MKQIIYLYLLLFSVFSIAAQAQNQILILNKSADTAWQLDAATGEKLAEYTTGTAPHEVAVSPDNKWAVITNYGNQQPGNSLTVINLEKREVAQTIDLNPFQRPHGIEWFSDNKKVIVSVEAQQSVIVVDAIEGTVFSDIQTNESVSHMVQLSPDEIKAYVTNLGSGSLTVLHIPEQKIIKTIATGEGTEGLTLANNGSELWVSNRESDTISIIDTETLEVIETLESKGFPIRAETSPNGKYVAISNARASSVAVFDAQSKERLAAISTKTPGVDDGMPIGLTFSEDNSRLYVANSNANQIVVINTDSWEVLETFSTGDTPDGIAFISGD